MDAVSTVTSTVRRAATRVAVAASVKHSTQALLLGLGASCIVAAVARFLLQTLPPLSVLLALLLVLPAAIAVWFLTSRPPRGRVAKLVDDRLGLRDRLSSALEFAAAPSKSEAMLAQLADAAQWSASADLRAAFPITLPREAKFVLLGAALLAALVALPLRSGRDAIVGANGPSVGRGQADEVKRLSEEHLDLANKLNSDDLRRLAQQLADIAEKLRSGLLDRKQALAMLSQLMSEAERTAPSAARDKLAQQLKALAAALSRSEATRDIAKSLEKGNLSKAAADLKSLSERLSQLSKSQQEDVAKTLSQASSSAAQRQEGTSEARSESERSQSLIRDLADRISQAERDRALGRFQRDLEMAKHAIAMGSQQKEAGKMPGKGWGKGGFKAGFGASNAPQGEASRVEGKTMSERAKGAQGAGPTVEEETLRAQRDDTKSARPYREVYAQYQKQMEEALEREDIPLGYRYRVKRYFEAIKPKE